MAALSTGKSHRLRDAPGEELELRLVGHRELSERVGYCYGAAPGLRLAQVSKIKPTEVALLIQ